MKEMLILNLKITIAFAIFYLVYLLFFSKDTFFIRNRFYLLFAMIVAVSVPLLKIPVYVNADAFANLPLMVGTPIVIVHDAPEVTNQFTLLEFMIKGLFWLYLAGVMFMLLRLFWGIRKIVLLIRKASRKKQDNMVVASIKQPISPFSIYRWLIIPEEYFQHQDITKIVQHELVHCRQYHSIDLLVAEIVLAFQWFNPFAWMVKKAITQNHEFIVDQKLLANGLEPKTYQYSLLHTVVQGQKFPIVNHFNSNLLKKRIAMMNKCESPKWYGIKNLMILISMVAVVGLTATFESKIKAQGAKSAPTVYIDGKKSDMKSLNNIDPSSISSVKVLKDSTAFSKYGKDGKNGVIEVIIKDSSTVNTYKPITYESTEIEINESHPDSLKTDDLESEKPFFNKNSLIFLDGKKISTEEFRKISHSSIKKMEIYKGEMAVTKYGREGKDGVVVVSTKDSISSNDRTRTKVVRIYKHSADKDSLNSPKGFSFRSDGLDKIPLIYLDGKKISQEELTKMDPSSISRVEVLKGDAAKLVYGEKGKDGVVLVTSKSSQGRPIVVPK